MKPYLLTTLATDENFNEEAYLFANPDVALDVKKGISLLSGRQHYEIFGKAEGRNIRLPFTANLLHLFSTIRYPFSLSEYSAVVQWQPF